jgi:hypothetical protein
MRTANSGIFRCASDLASREGIRQRRIFLSAYAHRFDIDFKYTGDLIEDINQAMGSA